MNILDLLNKKEEKHLTFKKYTPNKTIFKEGDKCFNIGIILEGSIKIVSYSLLGNELVFNILNKDQIFGNNLVFSSYPYYKGDIIATTNTTIAYINKNDLLKILKNNNSFLEEYLKMQSDFGKELNSKIKLLSFNSAKERLLFFLEENDGSYEFKTISALAKELNLERESLSRTITKLIKEKIIYRDGKLLILNK